MNLCSQGHEEIVYRGRVCPYCSEIENYENKIKYLEEDILNLEAEKLELKNAIEDLKTELSHANNKVKSLSI
jgi:predicted RNase H-like nuclease (RuvC/YqgF family)